MIAACSRMILAALALSGCVADDPHAGQRTVFNNPHAAPVIDQTGIGPQCNVARGEDATCLGVPLTRAGRGTVVGDRPNDGLNRNQRRILRERAELLRQISEQQQQAPDGTAPPPLPPPVLPTADSGGEFDTDKP